MSDVTRTILPAAHPLLARLVAEHGATELTDGNLETFCAAPGPRVLVFTEDPVRYRETLDLAVIVPELMRAFPGRFATGVLFPDSARGQQLRFGFRRWPALVVLRDGGWVGAIDGLRNWDEYLAELGRLLDTAPERALPPPAPLRNA